MYMYTYMLLTCSYKIIQMILSKNLPEIHYYDLLYNLWWQYGYHTITCYDIHKKEWEG